MIELTLYRNCVSKLISLTPRAPLFLSISLAYVKLVRRSPVMSRVLASSGWTTSDTRADDEVLFGIRPSLSL